MKKVLCMTALFISMMLTGCSNAASISEQTESQDTESTAAETETAETEAVSETEEAAPETEAAEIDPDTDPTEGTKYTKGTFENGVYTNAYAGISITVPEGLEEVPDSDLEAQHAEQIDFYSDDPSRLLRIAASRKDMVFSASPTSSGPHYYVSIDFLNTEIAAPDQPDYAEENYLDDQKAVSVDEAEQYDVSIEYEERTGVTLGGKEYVREICRMSTDQVISTYARKLDENLMVIVEICGTETPEYYEALFS